MGIFAARSDGRSDCTVCKSPFSESSFIPQYGRGLNAKYPHWNPGIPDQPKEHRKRVAPVTTVVVDQQQQRYPFYSNGQGSSMGILHSTAGGVLDEIAFSLAPEMVARGSRGSRRKSGHELRAGSWLHELWGFLFCCAVLCLAFF